MTHAVSRTWSTRSGRHLHRHILWAGAFVACSSSDGTTNPPPQNNPPPDTGMSALAVTGEFDASVNGGALFGTFSRGGSTEWVLFFNRGSTEQDQVSGFFDFDVVSVVRESTTRPDIGTFTIHDGFMDPPTADDFVGIFAFARTDFTFGTFLSQSGTLTIDASSEREISGSMDFVALEENSNIPGDSIRIQGTFRAVLGTIPSLTP